jgi:SpoVK/Ycf46/Vps4 family AAA+-type ATPase
MTKMKRYSISGSVDDGTGDGPDNNSSETITVNKRDFREFLRRMNDNEWKSPGHPHIIGPGDTPKKPRLTDRNAILSPLEGVFLESDLMDELVVRTSIPQLLEESDPIYPGVILYGPPGTGKSEFQRAVCDVYINAGAYAKQVSSSAINSCLVGRLAQNLEQEILTATKQAEIRKLPSFLSFDEGSIFAEKSDVGANSVSKHYQEAIDVFKRYLGNDIGKQLVVSISTNSLSTDFEDAMVRDGRLTSFLIGHPSLEQISRMWGFFLNKNNIIEIEKKDSRKLAELTPLETGAFIEQFCRGYMPLRRQTLLNEKGYPTLLDALKDKANISEEDVRKTITFEMVENDLNNHIESKRKRNGNDKRKDIGFRR